MENIEIYISAGVFIASIFSYLIFSLACSTNRKVNKENEHPSFGATTCFAVFKPDELSEVGLKYRKIALTSIAVGVGSILIGMTTTIG